MKLTRNQFFRAISATPWVVGAVIMVLLHLVGCRSQRSPEPSAISTSNAFAIISDTTVLKQYIILDVRGKMDYVRGHLGPAIWIAADSLKDRIKTLSKEKSVIVYDSTGKESAKAADFLIKNGFTKVFILEGGVGEWIKIGLPVAVRLVENTNPTLNIKKKDISVDKVHEIVQQKNGSYAIIDVRSYPAFKEGHIQGAVSIPYAPINEFVIKLTEQNYPKNKPLIVYCVGHTCNIGDMAIDVMLRNGYTHVYLLADGIEGWMSRGYPVEKTN